MGRRYLITGGAGFIGSNFIRHLLEEDAADQVTNLDALTYAGVPTTVAELDGYPAHRFVKGDIRDVGLVDELMPGHDVVVHFAAESHVDRSIGSPADFVETNVTGTHVLLEAARAYNVGRFIQVSTDEVYGSIASGFATEEAPLRPSSPYSASKAGADLLALSCHATYGQDVVVTRCTNNFGPYQFPEKIIPLFITTLLEGGNVPLYGDGLNERDWLHVTDHCAALQILVEVGEPGEIYNIGANNQVPNITLTRSILATLGFDDSRIDYVEDRPGHDRRYAVDSSKVRALGWQPERAFGERLLETIDWYGRREDWWRPLKARP
jgi:dTDP-glucose 4,6-dehydratase